MYQRIAVLIVAVAIGLWLVACGPTHDEDHPFHHKAQVLADAEPGCVVTLEGTPFTIVKHGEGIVWHEHLIFVDTRADVLIPSYVVRYGESTLPPKGAGYSINHNDVEVLENVDSIECPHEEVVASDSLASDSLMDSARRLAEVESYPNVGDFLVQEGGELWEVYNTAYPDICPRPYGMEGEEAPCFGPDEYEYHNVVRVIRYGDVDWPPASRAWHQGHPLFREEHYNPYSTEQANK